MARICVAVACKGQAHFLAEAVGSLRDQTFEDWEAVVACGDIESQVEAQLLARSEPRVWVLQESADRGISDARNLAIRASGAPYCMALDADDKLDATYMARTLPVAGPMMIATTNLQEFGDRCGWWDTHELTPQFQTRIYEDNMLHCASVFSRDLFEKAGGYDTRLNTFEDWGLWIAMARAGATVAHVPERLFYYRRHPGSSSTDARLEAERNALRRKWAATTARVP